MAGDGSPPSGTEGTFWSTVADYWSKVNNVGREWKGGDTEWTHGPVLSIVNGNKHKHTVGYDKSIHIGASLSEVFGLSLAYVREEDYTKVSRAKWERNVGLKWEQVQGPYTSHEYAGDKEFVQNETMEINPTTVSEKCPEVEELCRKALEKFKGRFEESRNRAVEKMAQAKENIAKCESNYKKCRDTLGTAEKTLADYQAKLDALTEEAQKYKIETDKFCKTLATAGIELKASKIKGSAKKKTVFVAKALAEFKGKIKLGG